MADVGDIKSGSLAHQYYPGRLPHLRSPSLSSFHPSRTQVQHAGAGLARGRALPASLVQHIHLPTAMASACHAHLLPTSSPIVRVRGTDQLSDAAAPDLQPPQSCLLIRGERGASSRPRDGGWPGPVSLAPGHCKWALAAVSGGITAVLSSPESPSGCKAAAASSATRLGALLPLPSCLLPVRSHLSLAL